MENLNGKITVSQVVEALAELAPPALAMEWDNPGLQVGRRDSEVKRVYVALDVNDAVLRAAFEACCDMIVTHHPLIFGKIDKVNDGDHIGRWILMMAEEGIACYAMHTNFDIAPGCMADLCATRLGLEKASPLEETGTASRVSILDGELQEEETETIGIGKIGRFEDETLTVRELAERVKDAFDLPFVTVYSDDPDRQAGWIAMCPGSAKGMLDQTLAAGCDVLIGGDLGHHDGIDAVAEGVSLINAGHYGLEHVFIDAAADYLESRFGGKIAVVRAPVVFPEELV